MVPWIPVTVWQVCQMGQISVYCILQQGQLCGEMPAWYAKQGTWVEKTST